MAGAPSKFNSAIHKTFLKPFGAINKRIHEITGKKEMGGGVKNPEGKPNEMAGGFRQVGQTPEDKSGFQTQHLGDNK